ncbi:MAG: sulfatase [Armatimonadota bacterium]|nr:sulfatase [Armatimonadota bacterium]MDR7428189.1 sulfatase [Armatimonadota bacterium]MDR7469611.1 sulfatase [Armatimonadota bacterium]MDR7475781.1 sulfatase [Armatimonadota bacterium]
MPRFGACAGLLLALVMALAFPAPSDPRGRSAPSTRPNIVFILTDDEDVRIHAFMPKTKALLQDRGTTFVNFFVTYALCCPSRASILRGQYPHNTRIEANEPPLGGFAKFVALGQEHFTLATWLHDAGYHTVFAGKYLNGYGDRSTDPAHVPPGWTEWYAGIGGRPYQNFNYQMNENGTIVSYGVRPEDYLTDVIARKGIAGIRRAVEAGRPFLLYLAPYTPHAPATPAPRHSALFQDAGLPHPPAFNEEDLSDKPAPRSRPMLTERQISEMESFYRKRLQSLQAIDDLVEAVVRTLQEVGQLENTYIVYTSDNGFHMGEHRLLPGKATAYEEDIRVPFILRGPGVPAGARREQMVLNTDIAPTFAEMAGLRVPPFVDGRSFLPLLRADRAVPWRQNFIVELRTARGLVVGEPGDGPAPQPRSGYNALRTAEWTYIQWATGERELYNLRDDPFQLQNLMPTANRALIRALAARLSELAQCSALGCRRAEDAPLHLP